MACRVKFRTDLFQSVKEKTKLRPLVLLLPKIKKTSTSWLSYILTLSVPDEGYYRNPFPALN